MSLDRRTQNRRQSGNSTLKRPTTILEQETDLAREELDRPAGGLVFSGLLAGFTIGVSLLLMAMLHTLAEGVFSTPVIRLLEANAYAVRFALVILGNLDLFTEYTTMAILPVLSGSAGVGRLVRLWGLVYIANVLAASAFAGFLVILGPGLGVIEPVVFGDIARRLTDHSWHMILMSGILAGWLMGLLSWLVSAGRETISQIFFVWLVTGTLGFVGLHHSITGTAEVVSGVFAAQGVTWAEFARFLAWTTLGNVVGGVIFALLIRYSVVIGAGREQKARGLRGAARSR